MKVLLQLAFWTVYTLISALLIAFGAGIIARAIYEALLSGWGLFG